MLVTLGDFSPFGFGPAALSLLLKQILDHRNPIGRNCSSKRQPFPQKTWRPYSVDSVARPGDILSE